MFNRCPKCEGLKAARYDTCFSCSSEYRNETVLVAYQKIAGETPKAWRVVIDDSDPFQPRAFWAAKSIATLDEENYEMLVPRWFAEQENLETLSD